MLVSKVQGLGRCTKRQLSSGPGHGRLRFSAHFQRRGVKQRLKWQKKRGDCSLNAENGSCRISVLMKTCVMELCFDFSFEPEAWMVAGSFLSPCPLQVSSPERGPAGDRGRRRFVQTDQTAAHAHHWTLTAACGLRRQNPHVTCPGLRRQLCGSLHSYTPLSSPLAQPENAVLGGELLRRFLLDA
ncbi:Multifunctional Protein Ade2 [Manis pentadactyla]|nr:Multifunctional Protein Ade2 [Manis pentadactyla]